MKWQFALVVVACGCSDHRKVGPDQFPMPDAPFAYECNCNPLQQSGCAVGEKCTWVLDPDDETRGFVGCAKTGSAAIGEACTYSVTGDVSLAVCGPRVADNCVKGAVCSDGICKAICDNAGGDPTCDAQHACVDDPALFITGMTSPHAAGVCELACDPLADNDFLGSGVRGSGCAAGSGCYGDISRGTPPRTQFACMPDGDAALVNRSAVATPAANSCAEGYLPLVHESTGSTTIVCVAMCAPGDTYLGNPGPQAPLGRAPHRCATSDARGVFGAHEHCMYAWRLEQDGSGSLLRSPFSDALGVCIDHAQYRYDSNADGTIDGSDAAWPDCQDLPVGSAAEFGCVSTTTAGTLPGGPPPGL